MKLCCFKLDYINEIKTQQRFVSHILYIYESEWHLRRLISAVMTRISRACRRRGRYAIAAISAVRPRSTKALGAQNTRVISEDGRDEHTNSLPGTPKGLPNELF